MAKISISQKKTVINTEELEVPDLCYKTDGAGFYKVVVTNGIAVIYGACIHQKKMIDMLNVQTQEHLKEILPLKDSTEEEWNIILDKISTHLLEFRNNK